MNEKAESTDAVLGTLWQRMTPFTPEGRATLRSMTTEQLGALRESRAPSAWSRLATGDWGPVCALGLLVAASLLSLQLVGGGWSVAALAPVLAICAVVLVPAYFMSEQARYAWLTPLAQHPQFWEDMLTQVQTYPACRAYRDGVVAARELVYADSLAVSALARQAAKAPSGRRAAHSLDALFVQLSKDSRAP